MRYAPRQGQYEVPFVLDRPDKPEGPLKVTDVTKETCVVAWKAPLDNGGCTIEKYIIEKQDTSRGGWVAAGEVNGETTSLRVTKLTAGKEYLFRVRAVNKEGESDSLDATAATLAKNPFDEPGAPGQPEIADWDKSHVDLQWQSPVSDRGDERIDGDSSLCSCLKEKDGGSPIEKYVIERREKGKDQWQQVSRD